MQISNIFSYVYSLSSALVDYTLFWLLCLTHMDSESDAYEHCFFSFADVLEKHVREIMRAEKGASSRDHDNLYRSMKSI